MTGALTQEGAEAAGVPTEPAVPSIPKRMIDEWLTENRHLSILDADRVRDFLLDLRAEV